MKYLLTICAAIISISFISGCGVLSKEPYVQTQYYDIGQADQIPEGNYTLDITPFTTTGPYRGRMIYRENACHLHFDEYNRWVQAPNIMLSRFLQEAFASNATVGPDNRYKVVGELVEFDIDLDKKKVTLTVEYEIYNLQSNALVLHKTISLSDTFPEKKPEAFARAFNVICNKLAQRINISLKELQLKGGSN